MRTSLSAAEARRVALAAQGFDRERPAGRSDIRHFRRVLRALGLLQLDFVNVLMPAHYLVMWSRLGGYDRVRFDSLVYGKGEYTEQWAHEASIVPASSWPLLGYRREEFRPWPNSSIMKIRNRAAYLDAVLKQVKLNGAVTANDLPPVAAPRGKAGDWHRSVPRAALDYHFGHGSLAVAHRLPSFQRVYDLPERVLSTEHLSRTISRADAQRELLRLAANALGIATAQDLADYYRMSRAEAGPRIQELLDDGALAAVDVEGWSEPALLADSARCPRAIEGASILSPFDPVVWYRPRAERLFNFRYRIEIYVPAAKRKWGYYVLPFRVGDSIVGRVDLKADRQAGQLLVRASHEEPGTDRLLCCTRLAAELHALKEWLQLDAVCVTRHNDFSRVLASVV